MRNTPAAARLAIAAFSSIMLLGVAPPPAQSLYQSMYVVSGTGEAHRQVGFAEALRRLMVKVSGDRRLAEDPIVAGMVKNASSYVNSFAYLDLKNGIPIHDEQGSYDRPQYLTVTFDQAKIDAALNGLHRKPWIARPRLAVFLGVQRNSRSYVVNANDDRDEAMRESFGNASLLYGVPISFPDETLVAGRLQSFSAAQQARVSDLDAAAKSAGEDQALLGTLVWSDPDRGWVADWTISYQGQPVHWQLRGVSFDDAFRDGLSGAALVLSGNGKPGEHS